MQIRAFDEGDTDEVVALWRLCGLTRPWNDPHRDIQRKLEVQRELFLVGVEEGNGAIIASIMAGYDGHRGWVNYLAVHPDARGAGHGRALMTEVEEKNMALIKCPECNHTVSTKADVCPQCGAKPSKRFRACLAEFLLRR